MPPLRRCLPRRRYATLPIFCYAAAVDITFCFDIRLMPRGAALLLLMRDVARRSSESAVSSAMRRAAR